MSPYIVAVVGSVLVLAGIFELLRRRQLSEKYAVLWLVVGVLILALTVFPQLLNLISRSVGVVVPLNLLFFVAVVFLFCVTLHLSWELSRLENETRKLAEDLAILRLEVDEVKHGKQPDVTDRPA
ncbi:MAG TPA: DUF2304 domain-containing protein [Pseudonocardiaceae bacterium]|jgi:hypothetical protein|nr:DUF2304 domain-containing protein [Pseudonocardiaceae bacterium]